MTFDRSIFGQVRRRCVQGAMRTRTKHAVREHRQVSSINPNRPCIMTLCDPLMAIQRHAYSARPDVETAFFRRITWTPQWSLFQCGRRLHREIAQAAVAGIKPLTKWEFAFMTIDDDLLIAFTRFNDAAYAISHCQIVDASAAVKRLEDARNVFNELFIQATRPGVVNSASKLVADGAVT